MGVRVSVATDAHFRWRSPAEITERLDRLINDIRIRFHDKAIGKPQGEAPISDVLLIAHGHILRAFAMRWIGRELTDGVSLLLEGKAQNSPFGSNALLTFAELVEWER